MHRHQHLNLTLADKFSHTSISCRPHCHFDHYPPLAYSTLCGPGIQSLDVPHNLYSRATTQTPNHSYSTYSTPWKHILYPYHTNQIIQSVHKHHRISIQSNSSDTTYCYHERAPRTGTPILQQSQKPTASNITTESPYEHTDKEPESLCRVSNDFP